MVHGAMLLTLIVMPLSGISMSLLGGRPIDMYGLFTIPPVAEMKDLARSLARGPRAMPRTRWPR
jgi:cytochrome b561